MLFVFFCGLSCGDIEKRGLVLELSDIESVRRVHQCHSDFQILRLIQKEICNLSPFVGIRPEEVIFGPLVTEKITPQVLLLLSFGLRVVNEEHGVDEK